MEAKEMTTKRYECLELDCDFVYRSDDDDDLVAAVEQHMAEEHDTFELEEVILANAVSEQDG